MPDPPTARRRHESTAADEAERKARLDAEARPHGGRPPFRAITHPPYQHGCARRNPGASLAQAAAELERELARMLAGEESPPAKAEEKEEERRRRRRSDAGSDRSGASRSSRRSSRSGRCAPRHFYKVERAHMNLQIT